MDPSHFQHNTMTFFIPTQTQNMHHHASKIYKRFKVFHPTMNIKKLLAPFIHKFINKQIWKRAPLGSSCFFSTLSDLPQALLIPIYLKSYVSPCNITSKLFSSYSKCVPLPCSFVMFIISLQNFVTYFNIVLNTHKLWKIVVEFYFLFPSGIFKSILIQ